MYSLFLKGGPIMWPLLVLSVVALTIVIERIVFVLIQRTKLDADLVKSILFCVRKGQLQQAFLLGENSQDPIVKVLVFGLERRDKSLTDALLQAASQELKKFNRGIALLDLAITLAPLLGLLGTVVGLIHSFGLLGASELEAPIAITGGIAQALIATAFGLGIAIYSLIAFNLLNSYVENFKYDLEQACTELELNITATPEPRRKKNTEVYENPVVD